MECGLRHTDRSVVESDCACGLNVVWMWVESGLGMIHSMVYSVVCIMVCSVVCSMVCGVV